MGNKMKTLSINEINLVSGAGWQDFAKFLSVHKALNLDPLYAPAAKVAFLKWCKEISLDPICTARDNGWTL